MATPTSAVKTAATTTLAVASGVTALWLTLGALDAPEQITDQSPELRIEYVDDAGNPIPEGDAIEPNVLVVDQFGEPYTAESTAASAAQVEPPPVEAVAYEEGEEPEEEEYAYDELEEEEEYEDDEIEEGEEDEYELEEEYDEDEDEDEDEDDYEDEDDE